MSFIVRTSLYDPSTGNAYATEAEVSTFASSRVLAWSGQDEDLRNAAGQLAMDYIDTRYVFRYGISGIPDAVKSAFSLLCVRSLSVGLMVEPSSNASSEGAIVGQTQSLGGLSKSITRKASSANAALSGRYKVWPEVEGWLSPYLDNVGSSTQTVFAERG